MDRLGKFIAYLIYGRKYITSLENECKVAGKLIDTLKRSISNLTEIIALQNQIIELSKKCTVP